MAFPYPSKGESIMMKTPEASDNLVRCSYHSPLGPMTLAANTHALVGVWFDGQKHMPDIRAWSEQPDHPLLQQARRELTQYFAGQRQQFELPLDTSRGTEFQRLVWQGLRDIPSGQTISYGALGSRIGRSAAVRAVGAAVGRNPLSIVVPCHRVLGVNGSLTGYAGGLDRKSALLQLESVMRKTIKT
jgi:methylated-DNA-[protein]-cysteine S-methyltransferase